MNSSEFDIMWSESSAEADLLILIMATFEKEETLPTNIEYMARAWFRLRSVFEEFREVTRNYEETLALVGDVITELQDFELITASLDLRNDSYFVINHDEVKDYVHKFRAEEEDFSRMQGKAHSYYASIGRKLKALLRHYSKGLKR